MCPCAQTFYANGNYFALQGKAPFRHLICPVPQPVGPGVRLALALTGQAKFGPDAQWISDPTSVDVQAQRGATFCDAVRKYWPGLPANALVPAYAGMRPKIHRPVQAAEDFVVQAPLTHEVRGLVNLFGIESPVLTGALALAEHIASMQHL